MKFSFSFRIAGLCTLALAFTGAVVSCNNSSNSDAPVKDSVTNSAPDTGTTKVDMNMPSMPDTMPVPLVAHAEAALAGTFADTTVSGTLKFDTTKNGKVKMTLDIMVPMKANKSVAVHIHEHGDCGDTAMLAHGHWNPTKAQHGKWGSASFHSGDIGNIKLDAKGNGHMTLETNLWTLGGSQDKNILGRSIIVHGGVDDYKSQPSGNSGTRIGCGVIK